MSVRSIAAGVILGLGFVLGVQALHTRDVSAQAAVGIQGIWLDDEGKGGVEIKGCGDQMCGNIVWLKNPLNPKGEPWTDKLNSDSSKRGRPICGLQIIGGLKNSGEGVWKGGWIYDPEEGKQFDVELTLKDANTLRVFGYAGVKLLGEMLDWRRMPNETPRCK